MPLEQSEGFVLRAFNVGEQDKIVVFFSRDKGIFKGIAKGARKFGNRFGSGLERLSLIKIFYYEKEGKELVTIGNCDLIESFFEIQKDLRVAYTLQYFAELIEEFSPSRAKDEILFRLLHSVLQGLKAGAALDVAGAYFEAWFLKINGFLPDLIKCRSCRQEIPGSGWLGEKMDGAYCERCAQQKKEEVPAELPDFLHWAKTNPPPRDSRLPFKEKELQSIRKLLQAIIVFHMEKEPASLRVIRSEIGT